MKSCPSLAAWELLLMNQSGPRQSARLQSHLERCTACRTMYERLQQNQDALPRLKRLFEKHDGAGDHGLRIAFPVSKAAGEPSESRPTDAELSLLSDMQIPGYETIRELVRTHFSVVYEALQVSTRQRVAVKVLHTSLLVDERARQRFAREIDLLVTLRHSSIVPVYDSGEVRGRSFFVMPFVEGVPPDRYVQERSLAVPEIVVLIQAICEAVGFAHRAGIIHRDIKPSNILVSSDGSPRVLDFGLGKPLLATNGAAWRTVSVDVDHVLGTPAFMSPEQAGGRSHEIDTRSDVYSLGVLAYKLLTGAMPYPVDGDLTDVLRQIRETAPCPLRRSNRLVDDELQTIVLTALSKDAEQRYQSAGAMAEDIGRYRAGRPIVAKGMSGWYFIRKSLFRHRWYAAMIATTVLLLGVTYASYIHRMAVRDREVIAVQRDRLAAADRRRSAEALFVKALDLLRRKVLPHEAMSLLDQAIETDPSFAAAIYERGRLKYDLDRNVPRSERRFSLEEIFQDLHDAHEQAGGDWLRDPHTGRLVPPQEANEIGADAFGCLLGFPGIRRTTRGELVQESPDGRLRPIGGPGMPRALVTTGFMLIEAEKASDAYSYFARAAALDPSDVYTRIGMAMLSSGGQANVRVAAHGLKEMLEDPTGREMAELWLHLGMVYLPSYYDFYGTYNELGDNAEAEQALRRAVELDPDCTLGWTLLGVALRNQHKAEEAIAALNRTLSLRPDQPMAWFYLGQVSYDYQQWDQAVEMYDRAIALDVDQEMFMAWSNRGFALSKLDRLEEAVESTRRSLQIDENFPETWVLLGTLFAELGRLDEAESAVRRGLELKDFSEGWAQLSHVLTLRGKEGEAAISRQKALTFSSTHR